MKLLLATLIFFIPYLSESQTSSAVLTPSFIRLTDSVACTSVKDQSQSPTCWVFGTNSLFESDYLKKYGVEINLSEMFVARYAYIDKAKRYLATRGKTYGEGGGQFHDVIRVINTYGIVPEEAYTGRPFGEYSHNHARLDTAMKRLIVKLMKEGKTMLSSQDLQRMNDTLDHYLGKVPSSFWYQQKQYTPKTFAKEVLQFRDDYVEVVSFTDKPLYKRFVLQDKYNWAGDSFYNISLDDMEALVDTAFARGWSVGWEGDVTEKGFNYFKGFATLVEGDHDFDEERVSDYRSLATERDHMLHITGIGRDENNRKWYYMKNSWGSFNKFRGYIYMQDEYFKLKTVILLVNKAALPEDISAKLGLR